MQNDSHPKTFDGGVEGHAVNSCHIDHVVRHAHEHDQGRSALSSPPKYKAAGIKPGPSDQLTKTPSADHDDGNLRGLSAPNHQPHAVSQGWRDDRVAVARALYEVGRKAIEPTLGMRLCDFEQLEGRDLKLHLDYADAAIKTLRNPPLPAPPSPPKYKAAGIKPGPSDQLTKTPSADHDDGNLRGLSAPNHQPHAVSQGWRDDMENAPSPCLGVCVFPNDGPTVRIVYRRVWHGAVEWTTHGIAIRATHWMPLPAPPSPAKTGGAE